MAPKKRKNGHERRLVFLCRTLRSKKIKNHENAIFDIFTQNVERPHAFLLKVKKKNEQKKLRKQRVDLTFSQNYKLFKLQAQKIYILHYSLFYF